MIFTRKHLKKVFKKTIIYAFQTCLSIDDPNPIKRLNKDPAKHPVKAIRP